MITGSKGDGIVVQNSISGAELSVETDGFYNFKCGFKQGEEFNIIVANNSDCVVQNGIGIIDNQDISVTISCLKVSNLFCLFSGNLKHNHVRGRMGSRWQLESWPHLAPK